MAADPAQERFDSIYRSHAAAVTAYVRRRTTVDEAGDVVADVFLVCWRKLADVPEQPLPWLYAVARKTLANRYRAAARQRAADALPSAPELPLPSDPVLGIAFARLEEHDREVLRLIAWEQLTVGEAAAALGCTPVACRVRLHRARRRLARHLAELEEAPLPAPTRPDPKGATP